MSQISIQKGKSISNHHVYGNGPLVLRDQCSLNILEVAAGLNLRQCIKYSPQLQSYCFAGGMYVSSHPNMVNR